MNDDDDLTGVISIGGFILAKDRLKLDHFNFCVQWVGKVDFRNSLRLLVAFLQLSCCFMTLIQ